MTAPCPFCPEGRAGGDPALHANPGFYVLGQLHADRRDAVMIVPHAHHETPFDIPPGTWPHLADALAFARRHLARHAPAGFTVGWNVGAVGGQHVPHAHLHVICRHADRTSAGKGLNALLKAREARP